MEQAAAATAPLPGAQRQEKTAAQAPLYRRSRPFLALAIMAAPFTVLVGVVALPFIGVVLLMVLFPVEFGRLGGRRLSRSDALWVALPAAALVATWEIMLVFLVLSLSPVFQVGIDLLGGVVILLTYGCNAFFFSVGALSTSFDPSEPIPREAR